MEVRLVLSVTLGSGHPAQLWGTTVWSLSGPVTFSSLPPSLAEGNIQYSHRSFFVYW